MEQSLQNLLLEYHHVLYLYWTESGGTPTRQLLQYRIYDNGVMLRGCKVKASSSPCCPHWPSTPDFRAPMSLQPPGLLMCLRSSQRWCLPWSAPMPLRCHHCCYPGRLQRPRRVLAPGAAQGGGNELQFEQWERTLLVSITTSEADSSQDESTAIGG